MGAPLQSFQAKLMAALKAEGMVPMSADVTRLYSPADNWGGVFDIALDEINRASETQGTRLADRYSLDGSSSYRERRYDLIKGFEGVRTTVYNDSGNPAIGLGFNMNRPNAKSLWEQALGPKGPSFEAVKKGKASITPAQAKSLFEHDVVYHEGVVSKAAGGRQLTDNQRLALVSVAYSSPARVAGWSKTIQSGDSEAIADLILHHSFAPGHSQSEGLKKRRYAEASLFGSLVDSEVKMPAFQDYDEAIYVDPKTGVAHLKGGPDASSSQKRVVQRQGSVAVTRTLPISGKLEDLLTSVGDELDVYFEVTSGGQPGKGQPGKRTGSTRHDHGNAADLKAYTVGADGSKHYLDMSRPKDREKWSEVVRLSVAGGATGIGAHPDYMGNLTMHIGYGSPGVWGKGGAMAGAPSWLQDAFKAGTLTPPRNVPKVASLLDTGEAPKPRPRKDGAVARALAEDPEGPTPRPRLEGQVARVLAPRLSDGKLVPAPMVAPTPEDFDSGWIARTRAREAGLSLSSGAAPQPEPAATKYRARNPLAPIPQARPTWLVGIDAPRNSDANAMTRQAQAAGLMFVETQQWRQIEQRSQQNAGGATRRIVGPAQQSTPRGTTAADRWNTPQSNVSGVAGSLV